MKCLIAALLLSLLAVVPVFSESLASSETHPYPDLISGVRLSGPLNFCGEAVPLDNQEVRERLEKELLLTLWDRPQVALWIKRSNRYLSIIEKKLQEHDMPQDLKYVAIIESALRPHAGSRRGAIGFWQFLRSTGQKYGLRINAEIDERRNIFASTLAAINYFKALYQMLGSWTLAAAVLPPRHQPRRERKIGRAMQERRDPEQEYR